MPDTDLFVAKEQFFDFPEPSQPVLVSLHTLARKGHPIIERNPSMWEPAVVVYDVEQPPASASAKSSGSSGSSGKKPSGA